jgi:hypothetical protein
LPTFSTNYLIIAASSSGFNYQFRPRASTFLFLDIFYSLEVRIKDDAEFHHATDTRGNGIYFAMPFVVIIALL